MALGRSTCFYQHLQNTARGGGAASRTLYCFEAERAGSSFETDRSDAFNA